VTPTTKTTYRVTVTGANGCTAVDDLTVSVDKAAPVANAGLDVTVTATNPTANLLATGGVGYLWSNGVATAANPVTPTITSNYSVTVTGANGCKASDGVTVFVEKKYSLSFVNSSIVGNKFRFTIRMSSVTPFAIGANNLRFNYNQNGLSNPTIVSTAFPSPAFGATTTTGSNPALGLISLNTAYNGAVNAGILPITTAGTDLVTMEFTITNPALSSNLVWRIVGANPRCVVVVDDKVTNAIPDVITGLNAPLSILAITGVTQQNVNCKNDASGSATVNAVGGLTPYSYLWSNGATTQTASNLIAGAYTVTVNDAFGYSQTASVTITEPATGVALSTAVTNVICFGASTGAIDLSATGGSSPYSFAWSNGASSEDLTNISAGSYTVTVTDYNGCTTTTSVSVTQNSLFTTNAGADVTVNCTTPETTLTAVGGVNFAWDNGVTQGGTVTPTTTTTYTVTATDANGCTATDAIVVTVDNTAPSANAGADQQLTCSSADYTFTATGGGSYEWSTGETTASITVTTSSAIIYTVTVTGSNGCTATDDVAIIDTAAPVFDMATVPANITLNCQDAIPSIDSYDGVIAVVADCDVMITGAETTTAGSCANSYVLTQTWTAEDASGNTSTVSRTITVQDIAAPTFTSMPPASGADYIDGTPRPAVLTATDLCSAVTIVLDSTVVKNPITGCQSYNNTVTRRWTATDACGNSTTVTQMFTESGTVLLTCPSNVTINTNSDGSNNYNCSTAVLASFNLKPNFADLCDITSVLKFNITGATTTTGNGSISGIVLNSGVNNVTYFNNKTVNGQQVLNQSCTFTVTVRDNELPRFVTSPAPVVFDACVFPTSLPTSNLPVVADNCGAPTLTSVSDVTATVAGCSTKAPTLKYFQSITRTWRVTDAAGNSTTATQVFYLRDQVAPTARCKNVTVTVGNTNISYAAANLNNASTDNCSGTLSYAVCNGATCTNFASSITLTKSMIPTGATQTTLTLRLRVTDACGNVSYCNSILTLKRAAGTLEGNDNNGANASLNQESDESVISNTPAVASDVVSAHGEMKCFPNPFSEDLNLQYSLIQDEAQVTLKVYDNQGRVVRVMDQDNQLAGHYAVRWNLSDLDSGMYHVCLEIGGKCQKVERVILMK
jgi:hypothetical protein